MREPGAAPASRWSSGGGEVRRLAKSLVARAPTLALRVVPPIVGVAFWAVRHQQRAGARRNHAMIRGKADTLGDVRGSVGTFIAFARSFAEGFAALSHRRDEVVLTVENERVLFDAVGAEKGCILLTAHTSSFEVAAAGLVRALGAPVVMAMRREPNAAGREVQDAVRRGAGLSIVHVDEDPLSALELARQLRAGATVGLQIDRVPAGVRGVSVRLFDRPGQLPLGPFALARATGAPLITCFTRRLGFLEVRIRASEAVYVSRRASAAEIECAAQRVADELTEWVREAPTEWLDWGEDRAPSEPSSSRAAWQRERDAAGAGQQPDPRG